MELNLIINSIAIAIMFPYIVSDLIVYLKKKYNNLCRKYANSNNTNINTQMWISNHGK